MLVTDEGVEEGKDCLLECGESGIGCGVGGAGSVCITLDVDGSTWSVGSGTVSIVRITALPLERVNEENHKLEDNGLSNVVAALPSASTTTSGSCVRNAQQQ
jgi:hypothetical protein